MVYHPSASYQSKDIKVLDCRQSLQKFYYWLILVGFYIGLSWFPVCKQKEKNLSLRSMNAETSVALN